MPDWFVPLLQVLLIDIVLAGDNAIVVGMAAAGLPPAQRRTAVEAAGHRAYRARQLSAHYFEGLRGDPDTWTDLPVAVRGELASTFMPQLLKPVRELTCDDGDTVKSLWQLHDGALVESRRARRRRAQASGDQAPAAEAVRV